MGDDGIVVGKESFSIGSVAAITADSRGQGGVSIHVDSGLAYPDVVHLITVLTGVAKGVVSVKILVLSADNGIGAIPGVLHPGSSG